MHCLQTVPSAFVTASQETAPPEPPVPVPRTAFEAQPAPAPAATNDSNRISVRGFTPSVYPSAIPAGSGYNRPALWGVRSVLLSAVVACVVGCGPFAIDYRPAANVPPPPATAGVALQVRNARPGERGGNTARVGTIYDYSSGPEGRNLQYHGRAVDTTSPDTVTRTVEAATADALAHAGMSIDPAAPMLIASVREYWFDGHPVHRTQIIVAYDLLDRGGRTLWHADYRGDGSATILLGSALVNTFRTALQEVARHAGEGFRSPEFQAALRH
jgi:hypothetical protein